MTNLVCFERTEELAELTGLTRKELWEYGFNLADWDWGFQSDNCFESIEEDECGDLYHNHDYSTQIPAYMKMLLMWMDT